MALANLKDYIKLVPALTEAPGGFLWSSYDKGADVLYVNFEKPSHATDSELTDDDMIIRYAGKKVIGVTILHASKFLRKKNGKSHLLRFKKTNLKEHKEINRRHAEMKKGKSVVMHPMK